jgi:hypothetical protein
MFVKYTYLSVLGDFVEERSDELIVTAHYVRVRSCVALRGGGERF